jgi:hypothetical protein
MRCHHNAIGKSRMHINLVKKFDNREKHNQKYYYGMSAYYKRKEDRTL